jgi:hypothetical protein
MNSFHTDDAPLMHGKSLIVGGTRCSLRTNSSLVILSFERYHTTDAGHCVLGLDLRIEVTTDECPRSLKPHFRGMHHVVAAVFSPADHFLFDLRRRIVTGRVSRSLARDRAFWMNVFVPICMGVMGPTVGLAPVHCACLEFEGEGLLIAGHSGAGKSTLTAALAKAGMSLISDDWTYVRLHGNEINASGLRVPLKLLPDAEIHFPELRSLETHISMNGELAYEFDPVATLKVHLAEECTPTRLIFLERSHGDGFASLSSEVALDYFLASAERLPKQLEDAQMKREEVLQRIALLPSFVFGYSGSPQKGAVALLSMLVSSAVSP